MYYLIAYKFVYGLDEITSIYIGANSKMEAIKTFKKCYGTDVEILSITELTKEESLATIDNE